MIRSIGQAWRRSVRSEIGCEGIGLHSGAPVRLRLRPAGPGQGIVFHRTDLGASIPARFDHVVDTRLSTVLADPARPEVRVATVEHLMAAFAGAGIDDAIIEVDAPELPILDGSAAEYGFLIACAGMIEHPVLRKRIEVLRPVRVVQDGATAELLPAPRGDDGFGMTMVIDFTARAIGRQALSLELTPEHFTRDLSRARTFTLESEIDALREAGLALGGSLANAVVVSDDAVLNPEGLRFPDEFVRHKLLDAVGDLALAGAPLVGRFSGARSGHRLNNLLLHALFADSKNYRLWQSPAEAIAA